MNFCKDCTKWIPDPKSIMGTCTAHRQKSCCGLPRPIATHASDGCQTQFQSLRALEVSRIDGALNSLEALCAKSSTASASNPSY